MDVDAPRGMADEGDLIGRSTIRLSAPIGC